MSRHYRPTDRRSSKRPPEKNTNLMDVRPVGNTDVHHIGGGEQQTLQQEQQNRTENNRRATTTPICTENHPIVLLILQLSTE